MTDVPEDSHPWGYPTAEAWEASLRDDPEALARFAQKVSQWTSEDVERFRARIFRVDTGEAGS